MRVSLVNIYSLIVVALLWSCNDDFVSIDSGDNAIMMKATVGHVENIARAVEAKEYRDSIPTSKAKLDAALLFSFTSGDYTVTTPTDLSANIPCHTSIVYENNLMTIPNPYLGDSDKTLRYPTDDADVYCVGLYPKSGWSITPKTGGGSYANFNITGVDDLMYASELVGSWNTPFRTQMFKHIQSWVKVSVCATSLDAVHGWGKLEEIVLISKESLKIDLTNGAISSDGADKQYVVMDKPHDLHITSEELGSVFCYPGTEFKLRVKTEEKGTREVSVTIDKDTQGKPITDPKGKLFVIMLYFNEFDIIEGVCTLSSWNNVNENLYLQ